MSDNKEYYGERESREDHGMGPVTFTGLLGEISWTNDILAKYWGRKNRDWNVSVPQVGN